MGGAWWWLRSWVKDHLLGVSLAIMVAGLVGGVAVTAVDPGWVGGGESGSTTLRNLGFVVAGLIALPLAVWRAQVADQQARAAQQQAETAQRHAETAQRQEETAQRQAETAQRQAETAQMDLRHRRYQEGIAMLRSDVLSECLTGIDALRRLAEEYPREYHIRIMTLLCAFVRHPGNAVGVPFRLHLPAEDDSSSSERRRKHELREDVQAAVEVISACHTRQRPLEREADFRLELNDADLQGLRLREGSLSDALLDDADLTGAMLNKGDLRGATLDSAVLVSADLTAADLTPSDLSWTILTEADLTDAELFHAKMDDADLTAANLSGTRFALRPHLPPSRPHLPYSNEAIGLTQKQLDHAFADPDKPPWLEGMTDPETGEQLVPPSNGDRWERYQRLKRKS